MFDTIASRYANCYHSMRIAFTMGDMVTYNRMVESLQVIADKANSMDMGADLTEYMVKFLGKD